MYKGLTRAIFSVASIIVLLTSSSLTVFAQQKKGPKQPAPRQAAPPPSQSDTLLIMPNAGTDEEDIDEALKEVGGEIVGSYGEGALKVLIVKTAKNKFAESEKTLSKDKHFKSVGRNYYFKAEAAVVNDPAYPQEWYLTVVNAPKAWPVTTGTCKLGILDTGCNQVPDLKGHCLAGYNAITKTNSQIDDNGHGTFVATVAAATKNNYVNTAGVAPNVTIVPIKMGDAQGNITTLSMIQAIDYAGKNGVKVINISANIAPPYSLANRTFHSAIHAYMNDYYQKKGGLIFNSAGNNGVYDSNSSVYYLNVVSGTDEQNKRWIHTGASGGGSNYGPSITFSAPATNIAASYRDGSLVSGSGTSFSCPIVAAIAAAVWSTKPTLKNYDVAQILKQNCFKPPGAYGYFSVLGGYSGSISREFGFGIPDEYKCVTGIKTYLSQPQPKAYYVPATSTPR